MVAESSFFKVGGTKDIFSPCSTKDIGGDFSVAIAIFSDRNSQYAAKIAKLGPVYRSHLHAETL